MHILLTRPQPDCDAMAAELARHGHTCLIAPLLDVTFIALGPLDLDDMCATIATSRNGLRAVDRHPQAAALKALPCFTVGPGSRDLAIELGFADVTAGQADAAALVPVILSVLGQTHGRLAYFAAETRRFDLASALGASHLRVDTWVAYQTTPATALPACIGDALTGDAIDVVTLMSPRTAATYVSLVNAAGVAPAARKPRYACLSAAVAARLAPLGDIAIEITDQPNAEEMLALIHRMAALSN